MMDKKILVCEKVFTLWKSKNVRPIEHRIIWWLLDVGAPGQLLMRGWQQACERDMGLSGRSMSRLLPDLIEKGILVKSDKGHWLNTSIFRKVGKSDLVRKMPLTRGLK